MRLRSLIKGNAHVSSFFRFASFLDPVFRGGFGPFHSLCPDSLRISAFLISKDALALSFRSGRSSFCAITGSVQTELLDVKRTHSTIGMYSM